MAASFVVSPATAQFTPFMNKESEKKIGAQQHPLIMQEFGGAYKNNQIASYADQIMNTIVKNSPVEQSEITFTVLNSPVVNAMALPGGYIYVTRGILALANSEAEVAGVLAHELGHVVERHSAERYSKQQIAGIGSILGAILTQSEAVGQILGAGSQLYLLNNSRQDEYEADAVGTDYLTAAGYDPYSMSSFLGNLERQQKLHATVQGVGYDPHQVQYLSTHPNTLKRVQRAEQKAASTGIARGSRPDKSRAYLNAIQGLLYGDDPAQGYVRGTTFSHPELRFTFTAPSGFNLTNNPNYVLAVGPNGTQVKFDFDAPRTGNDMGAYIRGWGKDANLQNLQAFKIRGMNAASAITRINTRNGAGDLRLVALAFSPKFVARFQILTNPNRTDALANDLEKMVGSFRSLSANEAGKLKPLRVQLVRVRRNDTIDGLANRMAYSNFRKERFMTLNGLDQGDQLKSGDLVKIVRE